MQIQEILHILACPICHGDLTLLNQDLPEGLLCSKCKLVYPIRNKIPVLLKEEAIAQTDWDQGKRKV
ncbi:MAG: Trm112 family protein [Desulfovibrio sp.]|nr:Trm112 family protein [Desulfovibrio sp.]